MKNCRIICMVSICMLLCLTGCRSDVESVRWDVQSETETESEDRMQETQTENAAEEMTEEKTFLYVDICGAVASPGVYLLEEGARVYQVIEMAGGLLPEADDTVLNRAEPVTDGMKLRVYTKDETKSQVVEDSQTFAGTDPSGVQSDGKVDLNRADASQLVSLPGIGETRASDIIAYRTEHGGFQTIEEIMNVPGIKDGTFQKIKDKITVG